MYKTARPVAGDDVKDIVGSRTARQAFILRDHEPQEPYEHEDGGEGQKDVVIGVHAPAY